MTIVEGSWICSCGHENLGHLQACENCHRPQPENVKFIEPHGSKPVTDPQLLDQALSGPTWYCHTCQAANRGDAEICSSCGAAKGVSRSHLTHHYEGLPPSSEADVPSDNRPPIGLGSSSLNTDPGSYRQPDSFGSFHSTALAAEPTSLFVDPTLDLEPQRGYQPSWEPSQHRLRNNSMSFSMTRGHSLAILGVIAVAVVVGLLLWATFHTEEKQALIVQFNWERTIMIDSYQTFQESDWQVPAGGRLISQTQKQSGTRTVHDGYHQEPKEVAGPDEHYDCSEDMGNGFFDHKTCSRPTTKTIYVQVEDTHEEPVYSPWYTYNIDRWSFNRSVPTSGDKKNDPAPYWGSFNLNCAGQFLIGCDRESHRIETYSVIFQNEDPDHQRFNRVVSYEDWLAYQYATPYTLVLNTWGITNDPLREPKHAK